MTTKTRGNLINNAIQHSGVTHEVTSPVTGDVMDQVTLATKDGITRALHHLSKPREAPSKSEVLEFLLRLKDQLQLHEDLFFEKTVLETGFIATDSREIVSGAIEFLMDFETYVQEQSARNQVIRHSYSGGSHRDMRITHRPFQCIAAIVPQNASLTLGIIIIASALYAGSRVILRPSLQCASTGALLAEAVSKSNPPESCVEIVNCLASDFLDACYTSDNVDLIHYIGSNQYAMKVFRQAFAAGKICLLDGQGNGMLYVDDSLPREEAIRLITSGATRFNGETCTSVNGVLIQDTVYESVKEALIEAFKNLRVGHPLDRGIQIGPLFSEKQAVDLQRTLQETPGGRILWGADVQGAYFTPAILEGVQLQDPAVQQGFFGPALWIRSIREDDLRDWLRANQFPLSDTVLSTRRDLIQAVARNSRAARICVNEDPSVESMFEPWGGYPPSGLNPVSVWTEKYVQTFQLDGRLKEIITFPSHLRSEDS